MHIKSLIPSLVWQPLVVQLTEVLLEQIDRIRNSVAFAEQIKLRELPLKVVKNDLVSAGSNNKHVEIHKLVAIDDTKLLKAHRAQQCFERLRIAEVDASKHGRVKLVDGERGRVDRTVTRSLVHKVFPAALRDSACQEGGEVEAVFEVDPAILGHSGHLILVDTAQSLPLEQHVDEQATQTDDLRGVTADLKQRRDVDSKLLLLQSRLLLLLVLSLHLKFFLKVNIFVTTFSLETFHVDIVIIATC